MANETRQGAAIARHAENTLRPIPTPVSNISAVLYSNSGFVPLVNRKYTLQLGNGEILKGSTDGQGFLQHLNIPPGDYTLMIDGVQSFVPTVVNPNERLRIHVRGYRLVIGDIGDNAEEYDEDIEDDLAENEWEDLDDLDEHERGI